MALSVLNSQIHGSIENQCYCHNASYVNPYSDSRLLGDRLIEHSDGVLEIIPKSPAEVIGERILKPVVNASLTVGNMVFNTMRKTVTYTQDTLKNSFNYKSEPTLEMSIFDLILFQDRMINQYSIPTISSTPNCLFLDCPDLEQRNLQPRQIRLLESQPNFESSFKTIQELFRFRLDDFREKALVTFVHSDWNGALDNENVNSFIEALNNAFDVKVDVTADFDHICEEVDRAAEVGKITYLFLAGHGSPKSISVLDQISRKITRDHDFNKCFNNMAKHGKIILISCSTGEPQEKDPYNNIAQDISDGAYREVIAPTDILNAAKFKLVSTNPLKLHHPVEGNANENLFRTFYPKYSITGIFQRFVKFLGF